MSTCKGCGGKKSKGGKQGKQGIPGEAGARTSGPAGEVGPQGPQGLPGSGLVIGSTRVSTGTQTVLDSVPTIVTLDSILFATDIGTSGNGFVVETDYIYIIGAGVTYNTPNGPDRASLDILVNGVPIVSSINSITSAASNYMSSITVSVGWYLTAGQVVTLRFTPSGTSSRTIISSVTQAVGGNNITISGLTYMSISS